jgi:hydroxyacylglutathione hydrolase
MIKIEPIKAFSDNYIWLVTTNEGLLVVDPGDAAPVESYLKDNNMSLSNILITHHHFDHTGGVKRLSETNNNVDVYGPTNSIFDGINKELKDGDKINILGIDFSIIEVPGHTLDHIAFFAENDDNPFLFCGDTLFAGGCGRIFEGTYEQMFESLSKLSELPLNTKVYCGHEYTLSNLSFALKVDKSNNILQVRYTDCVEARNNDIPTIPSTLELEMQTNPFLRHDQKDIQECIMQKNDYLEDPNNMEIFKALREWKDNT